MYNFLLNSKKTFYVVSIEPTATGYSTNFKVYLVSYNYSNDYTTLRQYIIENNLLLSDFIVIGTAIHTKYRSYEFIFK